MKTRLHAIEEIELDFYARLLAQGREEGSMDFEGTPQDQAVLVLAAIKGALQYARSHGSERFATAANQLKRSLRVSGKQAA